MIRLEGVYKNYGGRQGLNAVEDVSLSVAKGELCILIGPSGSGKTTTMRMINRLQEPSRGAIRIDGQNILEMDVNQLRRNIGYVIQQVGLFPHMTIWENVSIVLRLRGEKTDLRRRRADEMLELVGLRPREFGDRYPRQLSGGQQQRVGVARALAADPPIVLMDEPFGAVDPVTRKQLQRELRRIQSELKKTIVFVTHDISEAFILGDRIVLMNKGRVVQDDTPANILRFPSDTFVSDFIGEDSGLQSLQYLKLQEIAGPAIMPTNMPHQALPGSLSIREALSLIASRRLHLGEEIYVLDAGGAPSLSLSASDLVLTLAEAIGGDKVPSKGAKHVSA